MLSIIARIISPFLIIAGLIGCVIPVLPGPSLSFAGIIILAIANHFSPPLTINLIVVLGLLTLIVSFLDYVMPSIGAAKYGSSRWGILGSVLGVLVGIFYFPPLGMLVGGFLGAVLFELLAGKTGRAALKAGQGVFIGGLVGIILNLLTSGIIAYYFFRGFF